MNKKGFTLVELLATIAIIAIIATLAVPNIISMVSNGKTKSVISDAKEIIAQAKKERTGIYYDDENDKYKLKNGNEIDYDLINKVYTISLEDLDIDLDPNNDESVTNGTPDKDAYGNAYDKDSTIVKIKEAYQKENGESCSKGDLGCFKTYVYSIIYKAKDDSKNSHGLKYEEEEIKEQDLEKAIYE